MSNSPDTSSTRSVRRPTESECRILRVLWERGSATVREVHADLSADKEVGYTTVLSVDGARPAVELAEKHGLRYVHIPIVEDD